MDEAQTKRELIAADLLGFKDSVTGSVNRDPIWVAAYGDWEDACTRRRQDLTGESVQFPQEPVFTDVETRLLISGLATCESFAARRLSAKAHKSVSDQIKLLPLEPRLDTSKYEPDYHRLSRREINETIADAKTLRTWCQKTLDDLCGTKNISLGSAKKWLASEEQTIGQFKTGTPHSFLPGLSSQSKEWQGLGLHLPLGRLTKTADGGFITDRLPQLTGRWQDAQDNADLALAAIGKLAFMVDLKEAQGIKREATVKTAITAIDALNHYIADCDRLVLNSRLDWTEADYKQEANRQSILKEREKWAEPIVKQQQALENAGVLYTVSEDVQRLAADICGDLYSHYGTHAHMHEKMVTLLSKCQDFEKAFSPEVGEQMRKESSPEGAVLSPRQKTMVAEELEFYNQFLPEVVQLQNAVSENLEGNWKAVLKQAGNFGRFYNQHNFKRDLTCITQQAYLEGIDLNIKIMKGPPQEDGPAPLKTGY